MRVDTSFTPSIASTASGSVSSLESTISPLDASKLEIGDFSVKSLGTNREITAGFELMDRATNPYVGELKTGLGESDMDAVVQIERYVYNGDIPEGDEKNGIFATLNVGATGTETREGRLKAVLEAGLGLLEAAKGPGLNALNIAMHTGTIIVLATLLREYIASLVVDAIGEGDTPEASQAWAAVALAMTGPALMLAGKIGEWYATGERPTALSIVSCLCMASTVMGSTIAAGVTGTASKLLPSVGGLAYNGARAAAELVSHLKVDNAGLPNLKSNVATAAFHGVVFGALREVVSLMPLSGPARAAAQLSYDFGADVIQAGLNGFAMIGDKAFSIFSRSLLSPSRGLDSVFSDPESLQQIKLKVRAGLRLPTGTHLADAATLGGLRLSFGHAVNLVGGAVALWLSGTEISDDNQGHIVNCCLAATMMLLYVFLSYGTSKDTRNTYALDTPLP
ncbi:hypothetical protein D3C76_849120 [compost metagenome]